MILRLLNNSNKTYNIKQKTGIIYSINGTLRVAASASHWKVKEVNGELLTNGDIVNVINIDANNCCTLIVEKQ